MIVLVKKLFEKLFRKKKIPDNFSPSVEIKDFFEKINNSDLKDQDVYRMADEIAEIMFLYKKTMFEKETIDVSEFSSFCLCLLEIGERQRLLRILDENSVMTFISLTYVSFYKLYVKNF